LKIHFNIVISSIPRFPKWSSSLRSPHQNTVCTSPVPHTCPDDCVFYNVTYCFIGCYRGLRGTCCFCLQSRKRGKMRAELSSDLTLY
jgi:hypothetical protein